MEARWDFDLMRGQANVPSLSPENAIKRWNDFVKQYGTLEKAEVLGTASLNQSQGVQTFVRLKFKNAAGV